MPWLSANTCISMWRGAVTYFSISTRSSPKLDFASPLALRKRGIEVPGGIDAPHALAAAAGHRLDQHGIADLGRALGEELGVLLAAVIAGHHRHAGLLHHALGGVLQPHGAHGGGRRPDEDEARGFATASAKSGFSERKP